MTTEIQPPRCDEVRMAALARLDGEPAHLTSEEVDAHTATCSACQAAVADLTALHGALDRVDYERLDVELWPAIRQRLPADSSRRAARDLGAPRADGCARRVATRPAPARVARAGRQLDRAARADRDRASAAHGRSICHSELFTFTTAGRCVMNHTDSNVVLAQRYAYATVALVVGLLSFVNLFGFEKSILAVVLGLKALGRSPLPPSTPGGTGQSPALRSASLRSRWW